MTAEGQPKPQAKTQGSNAICVALNVHGLQIVARSFPACEMGLRLMDDFHLFFNSPPGIYAKELKAGT